MPTGIKIKAKEVYLRLEKVIGIAGPPQRLREVIESELQEYWGIPAIQAAERAEQLEQPVRQLIIKSRSESDIRGSTGVLSLSSGGEQFVCGSCYVEFDDIPSVANAKHRRLHIEPLMAQISGLTFREFELFGARILTELGAKIVRVTPHSEDQGIDFYGLLSLGQYSDLPAPFNKLAHDVTLRFAGQAKHYPRTPIGPASIRELIGSVDLARYRVFTVGDDLFDDLSLLPFNPLVTLFFTTGRFTAGALDLASKAGIITRTGEQLAVFLADQGVGIEETYDGNMQFNPDLFRAWLNDEADS